MTAPEPRDSATHPTTPTPTRSAVLGAAEGQETAAKDAVPSGIVWRETSWPNQWIGMHTAHTGGIRCNSRLEAEQFMRDMCRKRGCAWATGATR